VRAAANRFERALIRYQLRGEQIAVADPGARRAASRPADATVGPGMWEHWVRFWTWLNDNGPGVTAVVTAVYAFVTWLLWLATRRQAVATKRQVTLTQKAFEANNRPYLSVRIAGEDDSWAQNDVVTIQALVENVGTIPAEVTKWEISGGLMNLDGTFEPVTVVEGRTLRSDSVFPRDPSSVEFEFRYPGIYRTPLPLRFVVTLEYRGVSMPGKTYETVLEGERLPTTHRQRTKAT